MRITIERITPDSDRTTVELGEGEVVWHDVELDINGERRTFAVRLQARLLPHLDAGLLQAEELLEELLRFEPAALSKLLHAVGRARRGEPLPLPLPLIDDIPPSERNQPATTRP